MTKARDVANVPTNFPEGAWQSYTPVLTASTTNPTLGTGSGATGSYVKIGKTVIGRAAIIFGSSGVNAGSGLYRISLPVNRIGGSEDSIGSFTMRDASAGYVATVGTLQGMQSGADRVVLNYTGISIVNSTQPWTWAARDQIWINFMYEAE